MLPLQDLYGRITWSILDQVRITFLYLPCSPACCDIELVLKGLVEVSQSLSVIHGFILGRAPMGRPGVGSIHSILGSRYSVPWR